MPSTAQILRDAASFISCYGLHTGEQFASAGLLSDRLDVCAAIYEAAERMFPAEFYTDEDASLRLIECSAGAMAAIRAISDALDTQPCTTEVAPGLDMPDYIEHVSNWARTPAIGETAPPTTSEVIGRILRAAQNLEQGLANVPHQRAA
ncbi:DUF6197 family protein [Streptomyces sp. NPDC054847]